MAKLDRNTIGTFWRPNDIAQTITMNDGPFKPAQRDFGNTLIACHLRFQAQGHSEDRRNKLVYAPLYQDHQLQFS